MNNSGSGSDEITERLFHRILSPHLLDRLGHLQSITGKSPLRLVREAVTLYLARHEQALTGVQASGNSAATVICSSKDAATVTLPHFAGLVRSHLLGLFLSRRGAVGAMQVLATDCHNLSSLPVRCVLRPAVLLSAKAMVLAHNRPTGLAIPTTEDIRFANRVAHAAAALGMALLDHLIVANGTFASLFDEGIITAPGNGYKGVYRREG